MIWDTSSVVQYFLNLSVRPCDDVAFVSYQQLRECGAVKSQHLKAIKVGHFTILPVNG